MVVMMMLNDDDDNDARDISSQSHALARLQPRWPTVFTARNWVNFFFFACLYTQYQRVKISFEAERQRRDNLETHIASAPDEATRQELRPSFEQCEQRLKGLNLVLLYYASGLKCIYEEREEASDHSEAQA